MEQQFQLKYHGKLSLFEQAMMTSEDRAWFLKRLEKEFKEQADREKAAMGSHSKSMPRMPSMPRRR